MTFMTTVSQRPTNPTARVFINGRAILCFNQADDRAEVGFLDLSGLPITHNLLFTVYDGECGIARDSEGNAASYELPAGTIMRINQNNSGIGSLFYPATAADEDFRNLLSFDKIHAKFGSDKLKIMKGASFMARLYINNGVFYNAALSLQRARIFVKSNPTQVLLGPDRIGKVIGADLDNDHVIISIRLPSGVEKIVNLSRTASPYSIIIRYKCIDMSPTPLTDFEHFYDVLQLPTGHEVTDIEYEASEVPYKHPCEVYQQFLFENQIESEKFRKTNAALLDTALLESFKKAREACEASTLPDDPHDLDGNL